MNTFQVLYILLSIAGVACLWGVMVWNGTVQALLVAGGTQQLTSGRPLKTTYTNLPLVDDGITILVTFFDGITEGSAMAPRLLIVDLCGVLHCLLVWIMIDGRKKAEKSRAVRRPALWGLMWHVAGAAVILPAYCYVRSTPRQLSRTSSVGAADAAGLMLATLASSIPTLLMVASPWLRCGADQHQAILAVFQTTPLLFSASHFAASRLRAIIRPTKQGPSATRTSVTRVYFVAGAAAVVAHWYAAISALTSKNTSLSLAQVYLPMAALDADQITKGAHVFTQFDYLIVSATCALYAYQLLEKYTGVTQRGVKLSTVVRIIACVVLLGPGSTVMLALLAREHSLGWSEEVRIRKR